MNNTSCLSTMSTAALLHSPYFQARAIVACLMTLVAMGTLLGNSLVIASVICFRRLRTRNCFHLLASLATADIAIALLVLPCSMVHTLLSCWPLGDFLCKFYQASDIMCCTSSILHLCLISLDRYIAVTKPLHYRSIVRPRRIWAMVALVWTVSIGISFGPVFSGVLQDQGNTSGGQCQMQPSKTYAVVSASTSFFLPMLVMTLAYVRVHRIATEHTAGAWRRKVCCGGGPTASGTSSSNASASASVSLQVACTASTVRVTRHMTSETKATKTLGLILGCFYFCWFPFFIMYTVCPFKADQCAGLPEWLITAITWVGYINSGLNPILYCSNQLEFRLAYLRILGCHRRRRRSSVPDRYLNTDRGLASGRPTYGNNGNHLSVDQNHLLLATSSAAAAAAVAEEMMELCPLNRHIARSM